ncbi:MAG TPA: GNAT family N-acetyltransferase [Asticcacaulis sp.]|nr:GNAT family N-acetyltransferase [Asticcacaulis sp.]
MTYQFRRMTHADLPLVRAWLETPDAQAWWVDQDGNVTIDPEDLDHPGMRLWIVSLNGVPFAHMQDWDVHAFEGHYFLDRPPGTRGVDQMIGVPEMLGKGHGPAFMRQHIAVLFAEGAPEVVTDPDPANLRAVKAYQKAGFVPYGEHDSPEWGHVLLMSQTTRI